MGRNYYSISNYMVLIRHNKGAKIILHAKSPTFRAAKLKGFTVLLLLLFKNVHPSYWRSVPLGPDFPGMGVTPCHNADTVR